MSFFEAIGSVFRNYANFSGRARRSEYWYFYLFHFLVSMVFGTVETVASLGDNDAFFRLWSGLGSLYSLAVLLPAMAVSWRRLHDIGRSGWNFMIPIAIAVVMSVVLVYAVAADKPNYVIGIVAAVMALALLGYSIMMLVWLTTEGTHGDNRYGPDPKAPAPSEMPQEKAPWEY